MHSRINAEKLVPLSEAAFFAESRRFLGMRMVTAVISPPTRYSLISVCDAPSLSMPA